MMKTKKFSFFINFHQLSLFFSVLIMKLKKFGEYLPSEIGDNGGDNIVDNGDDGGDNQCW